MNLTLRRIVFAGLFTWIVGSPATYHLFGVSYRLVRPWRMYHSAYSEVCRVQYSERVGDNSNPLDRMKLLGAPPEWKASRKLGLLKDKKAVLDQGKRLCKVLGEGHDVRAVADCSAKAGWKPAVLPKQKLCEAPKEKPKIIPEDLARETPDAGDLR